MSELDRIAHLLAESGDAENPGPEALRDLVRRIHRVAVVGISRNPLKDARRVPSYLAAKGMDIFPVNPFAEWLLGRPARPQLSAVVEAVDLVLLFRPSAEAGPLIAEAARRPERPAVWLQEGIRSDAAARAARGDGIPVVQDLCLFKAHRALSENHPRPVMRRGAG